MRRLGPADVGHLAKILKASLDAYIEDQGFRISPPPLASVEGLTSFLLLGLPAVEEAATPWLGSLVGLSAEDSRNPDRFPLAALSQVLEGVHPDLVALVDAIKRMAATGILAQMVQQVVGGQLTGKASREGTVG